MLISDKWNYSSKRRPSYCNHHIEHNQVTCFKIKENLGYGLYYSEIINQASIVNNENELEWEKQTNE